jgi:restriction system protein
MDNDRVSSRRGEFLRLVFSFLWDRSNGATTREILAHISQSAKLTQEELAPFPSLPNFSNFEIHVRSAMTAVLKAGWLAKERGCWYATEEGRLVCKDFSSAQEFYSVSQKVFEEWLLNRPSSQIAIEYAEEMAWNQIQQYLMNLPHQALRSLVHHLIQAMDYQIAWEAPLSKQRGHVDMIVFPDPLGVKQPRMLVHIKPGNQATSVENLKASLSFLSINDVGLIVSAGGFTQEARNHIVKELQSRVFLVDLEKLYDLWIEHYEKLSQEAHQCFPLKAIHFLALEE